MENQSPGYYKRRVSAIFIFAIIFMFIGRNLSFIPKINLYDNKTASLNLDTQKIIKNKPGFYSVYYKDLKTGASFGIAENQIETGASVSKVPIVASLYYLAGKGQINLDEKITIQKNEVQDYGTGSLRYQTFPFNVSLRNLARLSLQQSDNTAAHIISVRIGTDKIQNLVNSWRMSQTDMVNNQTTTYDMSLIFEKIYAGKIANPSLTKELLGFMTNTDFEDRLPKDLPKNVTAYHKVGDGDGFVHDVGIIKTDKDAYYLGIMTSDVSGNETGTKDIIGQISKKIYDDLND